MRWQVREASGGAEALTYLEETPCEALLLDSWLPDLEAQELATHLRQLYPALDLIHIDESNQISTPVRSSRRNELLFALRRAQEVVDAIWEPQTLRTEETSRLVDRVAPRGLRSPHAHGIHPAGSFLATKEAVPERPSSRVCPSATEAREEVAAMTVATASMAAGTEPAGAQPLPAESAAVRPRAAGLPEMVGSSHTMETLVQRIRLVAPRKTTVLIEGPTGSGKELVARALHRLSARADRPFVVLNCAAIPDALLEAELFGHTRGAFTGAVQARVGRVEAAHGGTLFLDEIGEMPLALQAKLLRFLEAGEVQRIGENEPIKVDVRVIAATHQPLAKRSEEGSFRSDLYYRLSVFTLRTAPLAEHPEDIPTLAGHFLERLAQQEPVKQFDAESIQRLCAHSWPGNVRELAHVVERAYILAESRPRITAAEICFA
jgi:DNA-binding NtrC family response regulator